MEEIHTIEDEKKALLEFMSGLDPTDPKYRDAMTALKELDEMSRMTKQEASVEAMKIRQDTDVKCHLIDLGGTALTSFTAISGFVISAHAEQTSVIFKRIWDLAVNAFRTVKR